jgi:hypothetical protein
MHYSISPIIHIMIMAFKKIYLAIGFEIANFISMMNVVQQYLVYYWYGHVYMYVHWLHFCTKVINE